MQRPPRQTYLDCNATTPVLPEARAAALDAMAAGFGNPSSTHSAGVQARHRLESVRTGIARLLKCGPESLIFTSGATEAIQEAVFSAISHAASQPNGHGRLLLYGATEHKAVPQALAHWNDVLKAGFEVRALPVDRSGRIDLAALRELAPRAALVCTMAVNNETAVIQDLEAIDAVMRQEGRDALWLVDSVQALGKVDLALDRRRIDYAPFSGHKLYAPKGVGFLYVRKGVPFTPMIVGGGQERGLRSGTENLPGVAALGAVIEMLEAGTAFRSSKELEAFRSQILGALRKSFPGLTLNHRLEDSLPTTLNFAIPGIQSREMLDVFDAAGIRVSSGSACNSGKASRSHVLDAMGLAAWQSEGAVRLSWGLASTNEEIEEATAAIRRAGRAISGSCLMVTGADFREPHRDVDGIIQLRHGGSNTWLVASRKARTCVVIDPLEDFSHRIERFVKSQHLRVLAVVDTHSHADHESHRPFLARTLGLDPSSADALGWPRSAGDSIELCAAGDGNGLRMHRITTPGHTGDSHAFLLEAEGRDKPVAAFCGDTLLAGGLGRTDFETSSAEALFDTLRELNGVLAPNTVLCPSHDYENTFATTWGAETSATETLLGSAVNAPETALAQRRAEFARQKKRIDLGLHEQSSTEVICGIVRAPSPSAETVLVGMDRFEGGGMRIIDVREPEEVAAGLEAGSRPDVENVPLSRIVNLMVELAGRKPPENGELLFVCRTGNRSLQAARSIERLGIARARSLRGGLALLEQGATGQTTSG